MGKKVGLIGAGMIGSALARLDVAAGYEVILSNTKGPQALGSLVAELGPKARAASVAEAADEGHLVIASVPLAAYRTLPADRLASKIVIVTMNYYPMRDSRLPDIDAGKLTTSEMVQEHLPHSWVVKALHNLDFHHLFTNARHAGQPGRTTLPIAGDNELSKKTVAQFIDTMGYDSADIGSLAESWRIEPGTPIYVWPYVPRIPEGLNEEEARRWYLEKSGDPLSAEQIQEIVAMTERRVPPGGSPEDLPAQHVALVSEVYKSRSQIGRECAT